VRLTHSAPLAALALAAGTLAGRALDVALADAVAVVDGVAVSRLVVDPAPPPPREHPVARRRASRTSRRFMGRGYLLLAARRARRYRSL
jgi:hypothetical protein